MCAIDTARIAIFAVRNPSRDSRLDRRYTYTARRNSHPISWQSSRALITAHSIWSHLTFASLRRLTALPSIVALSFFLSSSLFQSVSPSVPPVGSEISRCIRKIAKSYPAVVEIRQRREKRRAELSLSAYTYSSWSGIVSTSVWWVTRGRSRPRIGPRVRAAESWVALGGVQGLRPGVKEESERKHLKNYPNSQEGWDSSPARAIVPRPTPNTY